MHIQESHWPTAAVTSEGNGRIGAVGTVNGLGADGTGASPGTVSTLGAALGVQVGGAGDTRPLGAAARGRAAQSGTRVAGCA